MIRLEKKSKIFTPKRIILAILYAMLLVYVFCSESWSTGKVVCVLGLNNYLFFLFDSSFIEGDDEIGDDEDGSDSD